MAYPSTFVDIQNAVINKLRLDATDDLDAVKDWINQAYATACMQTEALQDYGTLTLTADSATYELPTVLARIKWIYVTPSGGTQSMALEPVSLETMLRWRMGDGGGVVSGGSVQFYALSGTNLIDFYPTPTSADTVTFYYVKQPIVMSTDTETPEIDEPYASKVLEYGACAEAADFKRDPSEAQYRALFEQWVQKLKSHLNRKEGGVPKQFDLYTGWPKFPSSNDRDIR